MTQLFKVLCFCLMLVVAPAHAAFDHSHAAWSALASKHVLRISNGAASQVRYAGFMQDRAALKAYLATLSAVQRSEFDGWTTAQRMAFLMNAYNAYTVELILTKYPDLQSIKELGSLLQTPWKKKFFTLLGGEMSLDGIEQDTLRKRGVYDDPRLHFAVNCASIGCPMLREEAFVAEKLDAQLDQQAERFLSDRSRNRYNAAAGTLEVSKIFDWYGDDFKQGHKGIGTPQALFARYANKLSDVPAEQEKIRAQSAGITFLEYDWRLNDVKK